MKPETETLIARLQATDPRPRFQMLTEALRRHNEEASRTGGRSYTTWHGKAPRTVTVRGTGQGGGKAPPVLRSSL